MAITLIAHVSDLRAPLALAGLLPSKMLFLLMRHKLAHVDCGEIFLDLPVHTSCTRRLLTISLDSRSNPSLGQTDKSNLTGLRDQFSFLATYAKLKRKSRLRIVDAGLGPTRKRIHNSLAARAPGLEPNSELISFRMKPYQSAD